MRAFHQDKILKKLMNSKWRTYKKEEKNPSLKSKWIAYKKKIPKSNIEIEIQAKVRSEVL